MFNNKIHGLGKKDKAMNVRAIVGTGELMRENTLSLRTPFLIDLLIFFDTNYFLVICSIRYIQCLLFIIIA
jgi:hypothetical protein